MWYHNVMLRSTNALSHLYRECPSPPVSHIASALLSRQSRAGLTLQQGITMYANLKRVHGSAKRKLQR